MESNNLITVSPITNNKPEIFIFEREKITITLVDVAIATPLDSSIYLKLQKAAILNTCNIVPNDLKVNIILQF